jgi:hypothetical protein
MIQIGNTIWVFRCYFTEWLMARYSERPIPYLILIPVLIFFLVGAGLISFYLEAERLGPEKLADTLDVRDQRYARISIVIVNAWILSVHTILLCVFEYLFSASETLSFVLWCLSIPFCTALCVFMTRMIHMNTINVHFD